MNQRLLLPGALFALLVIFSAPFSFAQQKEPTRHATTAEKSVPVTDQPAAKTESDEKEKNQGDPQFRGMKYRNIGPFRGGRSLTAAGIPGDPMTYYFGATGGGVWKSTDGANTWSPIFDHDGAPAIGSLAPRWPPPARIRGRLAPVESHCRIEEAGFRRAASPDAD